MGEEEKRETLGRHHYEQTPRTLLRTFLALSQSLQTDNYILTIQRGHNQTKSLPSHQRDHVVQLWGTSQASQRDTNASCVAPELLDFVLARLT